jgi:hypothetical protein
VPLRRSSKEILKNRHSSIKLQKKLSMRLSNLLPIHLITTKTKPQKKHSLNTKRKREL